MTLERITITFNRDGSFRGASATDFDALPIPVASDALESFAPQINASVLARNLNLEAELAAEKAKNAALESLKTNLEQKTIAALASEDPAQFVAVALEFVDPDAKKKADLLATLAATQAALAELDAK